MPNSITPIALITGAGSGIGRAAAIACAREGMHVVLTGRRAGPLEETAALLPPETQALCLTADVSDPAVGHVLVTSCLGRFGRLDVLVNNAAFAGLRPIELTDAEMIEKTYFTNAIGPACTIAAAWLVFRRQFNERRLSPIGQCVVNISTLGTRDPFPGFFAYASSKACMNVMAHSCAKEGAEIGVRAFSIAPGAVETPMLRSLFSREVLPADHALAPERVAEEILACIVGERDALNGQTIYLSAD